jgi:hypothetical protein
MRANSEGRWRARSEAAARRTSALQMPTSAFEVGAAPAPDGRPARRSAPTKPPGRRVGRDAPALPCARRASTREFCGAPLRAAGLDAGASQRPGARMRAAGVDAGASRHVGAGRTPARESHGASIWAKLRRGRGVNAWERQGAPPCAAWRPVGARGTKTRDERRGERRADVGRRRRRGGRGRRSRSAVEVGGRGRRSRSAVDVGGRGRRGSRPRRTTRAAPHPDEAAGPSRRTRRPGAPMRAASLGAGASRRFGGLGSSTRESK